MIKIYFKRQDLNFLTSQHNQQSQNPMILEGKKGFITFCRHMESSWKLQANLLCLLK